MIPPPPRSTLFPYTTLFRSLQRPERNGHELAARPADVECERDRRAAHIDRQHRSEEHTSELQSLRHLVCRLLLEKKKKKNKITNEKVKKLMNNIRGKNEHEK